MGVAFSCDYWSDYMVCDEKIISFRFTMKMPVH